MKMTNIGSGKILSLAMLIGCAFAVAPSAQAAPKKVLVVTVTKGFRHSSIPTAEKVLGELAQKSGKFEVDYTPQEGTLIYESISRGVKSGGFTAHNTTTAAVADPFGPEKLTAYEVGVKSELPSR